MWLELQCVWLRVGAGRRAALSAQRVAPSHSPCREFRAKELCLGLLLGMVLVFCTALSAAEAQTGQAVPPKTMLVVVTDRPDAVYKLGEKATFAIEVKQGDQPPSAGEVTYALSLDGIGDLGKGKLKLEQGKASVSGTLDKPAILRCTVAFAPEGTPRTSGMAAAAFDPFHIEPTAIVPADFEQFWSAQKAELAKIAPDARLEPVVPADERMEVFKITLANIDGTRVHGYFGKPKGPGPWPAILTVPAAGVYSITPGWVALAASGFLAMGISAHDIEDGQPPEYYQKLAANELKDYRTRGREDRMTYYFRRVFLGCVRAIDFLTAQPEWDKAHVIVNGSSQGGGLALVSAGLDSRVTALAANVPALCDHSGRGFGRPAGWPQLVPLDKEGKLDAQVLAVSAYYDAANFARRITVPAIMGIGLIDTTCPATTNFAAYNVLRGPKQVDIAPLMGHAHNKAYTELKDRWIREQAGRSKQ